jgi:exonuclease III
LRIVSWNCNGALRKKLEILRALEADMYVIQECEDPAQATDSTYKTWASGSLWLGVNQNKGIGVFASALPLAMLDWPANDLELFIPLSANHLTILAVWARHGNSHNLRHIGQVWKYLQAHGDRLPRETSIVIGDFNSNSCWDFKHPSNSHSDVVRDLFNLGLESVYHVTKNEQQGKETGQTFFMYRKRDKSYHIDYAFASKAIVQSITISIGKADEWLEYSDHMPMILDIAG